MPSQQSLDSPPVYDDLLDEKRRNKLSGIWMAYLSALLETLNSYLSQNGMFLPQLTEEEISKLRSLQNGQIVYNLTIDAPQVWQGSSNSWRQINMT